MTDAIYYLKEKYHDQIIGLSDNLTETNILSIVWTKRKHTQLILKYHSQNNTLVVSGDAKIQGNFT